MSVLKKVIDYFTVSSATATSLALENKTVLNQANNSLDKFEKELTKLEKVFNDVRRHP